MKPANFGGPQMVNKDTESFYCVDCQRTLAVRSKHGTTGYGTDPETDAKICFACCGVRDEREMKSTGKTILYHDMGRVSNWPGTLVFQIKRESASRHNIAGKRFDVWFTGPDGFLWHGMRYGDNTQIIHCKRTKGKGHV